MTRKKLPQENRLNTQCRFRIEPDVLRELEAGAKTVGCNMSDLYRAAIRASVYNDSTARLVCNLVRDAISEHKQGEE